MRGFNGLLIALALALIALVSVTLARAQSSSDVLAKFATDDFSDTAEAVAALAASGNKMAAPIIFALQDGRLLYDAKSKNIFIKDAAGPFDDSSLFTNAYNFGIGPNPLGKFISGPYQGDGWAHPKPPWSWFDKFDTFRPGSWFFHPATVFGTSHLIERLRREGFVTSVAVMTVAGGREGQG